MEQRVAERTRELQQEVAERARLQEALIQARTMEAVGQLAGGIAHNFNNLLQVILGNAELATMGLPPDHPALKHIARMKGAGQRAAALTAQLLAFSRRGITHPRALHLGELARHVATRLRRTSDPCILIETRMPPDLWSVHADHGQMEQALMHLCLNARDAMPNGGRLTLELDNLTRGDQELVRLTVTDTGSGMDADIRTRIFEPFFTTKGLGQREVGKGTGLGLAIVYGVVTQLQGTVTVDSEPGRGTQFVLALPRSTHMRQASARRVSQPAPQKSAEETVLVVDDDEMVRGVACAALTLAGYVVLEAEDGARALSVYQQERSRIAAVLLDLTMPTRSGVDVLADLLQIDPAIRVVLCSGYSAETQGVDVAQLGAKGFLQKPYSPHDVARAIRQALDQAG